MKKILRVARNAVQVVLAAPVKLPAKLLVVVKYVGLALGILDAVVPEEEANKTADDEINE